LAIEANKYYIQLPVSGNWAEYYPVNTTWTKIRIKSVPRAGDKEVLIDLRDWTHSSSSGAATNHHGAARIPWGVAADCRRDGEESRMSINLVGTPFRYSPAVNPGGFSSHGQITCQPDGQVCTGSCGGHCGYCGFGSHAATEGVLSVIDQSEFDAAWQG